MKHQRTILFWIGWKNLAVEVSGKYNPQSTVSHHKFHNRQPLLRYEAETDFGWSLFQVRYTMKYAHSDGALVIKITDDVKVSGSMGVTLYAFGVPLGTPTEMFGTPMNILGPQSL